MALAGLSAAGSVASIGSLLFDAWGVKGREKTSTKLDRLLEKTGNDLDRASDTVKQNADILEPKLKTNVLIKVEGISIEHKKNIVRQDLAREGHLSRAERKNHEKSVRSNGYDANNVLWEAQVDSQIARTKLLLLQAEAEATHERQRHLQVPQNVLGIAPQGPASEHVESAANNGSYPIDSSTEIHESLQPNEDPFVDPALHSQGVATAPLEYELQSMSLEGPAQTA